MTFEFLEALMPAGPPFASPADLVVPEDGRQSERALVIRRGLGRLIRDLGFSMVAELPLASGRRAGRGRPWPQG